MAKNAQRRFDRLALAVVIAPVLVVAVANHVVDPFGLWHTRPIKGVSVEKPRRSDKDRLDVALSIQLRRPKALVFGTSTSKQLQAVTLQELTGERAVNAGIVMAGTDEAREYLNLALDAQPDVRHVVLNLDFFQFSEREDSSQRRVVPPYTARTTIEDALSSLCSRAAVMATIETLRANGLLGEKPASTGTIPVPAVAATSTTGATAAPDASRTASPGATSSPDATTGAQAARGSRPTTPSAPTNTREKLFRGNLVTLLKDNSTYLPYTPSAQAYANLRAIKEVCDEHGIELTVFLNPMHAELMDGLYARGLGDEYEDWMRGVAAITPVWDFAGYNPVTTEPVSGTMRYYRDPIHYSELAGDVILRRMIEGDEEVPGFGVPIGPDTVERRILDLRAQRARRPEQ